MSIRILSVIPGSLASQAGIQAGYQLEKINGESVLDEIDFQALATSSRLSLEMLTEKREPVRFTLHKRSWEPLGICLDETVQLSPRQCRNHCVFCFIDQMPPGMRKSLYVKDDDWRLSLMMGNYVTLTNVSDEEFQRILKRKASPLYISVHATDPQVRVRLLRNPKAARIMSQLCALRDNGLKFHAQIVLCPGLNDGDVLDQTLHDLAGLLPAAQSVAIVPVGVTRFREKLPELTRFTPQGAAALLDQVLPYQRYFLKTAGTRFVFPSDEFYCLSGRTIPGDEEYEDYGQIENGVGMIRQLERECEEAMDTVPLPSAQQARRLLIPTGVSAAPYIRQLAMRCAPPGTQVNVIPVVNRFFGNTITVTGLLVAEDVIEALRGKDADEILICRNMLRDQSDSFLDDRTVRDVELSTGIPVRIVENNGESFVRAVRSVDPPFEDHQEALS